MFTKPLHRTKKTKPPLLQTSSSQSVFKFDSSFQAIIYISNPEFLNPQTTFEDEKLKTFELYVCRVEIGQTQVRTYNF
ncbi:hypothetical protein ACFX2K_046309 [Malus domestica]